MEKKRRLVVGISGSSGVILGIRLLQFLQDTDVETHLVVSPSARLTIEQETGWKIDMVQALADVNYSYRDIGAAIASGSFHTDGMVIIPCSIKSLSAVANSYAEDLLSRAADVTLKEGRPLVLVVRETPLHQGHIRLMDLASNAGAIIFPPVPAFYALPQTVDDIVDHLVGRVLARLGIENNRYVVWEGVKSDIHETWPAAEFLRPPAMTLATIGSDGSPHAAAVYFAADDKNHLYFFSEKDTQHCQDLETNPHAAVTIYPQVSGWQEIRGIQMQGEVRQILAGQEWDCAWKLYSGKFPFVVALKDLVARNHLYVFIPGWIRQIDNRRGFGFKEERSL